MGSAEHVVIAIVIIIIAYDTSSKCDKKAQIKWGKIKIKDLTESVKPNTES